MDIDTMQNDEYASVCRIAENTFIRSRKMPLQDLLLTMINRRGLTLTLELRNYMKTAHPGTEILKLGYLKQRMKLNPDAFNEQRGNWQGNTLTHINELFKLCYTKHGGSL